MDEDRVIVNTRYKNIKIFIILGVGLLFLCLAYTYAVGNPIIFRESYYNNYTYKHFFYNSQNWIPGKNECIPYEQSTISSFNEIGEGYWQINPKERPITKGIQPLLYGTYYAQKIIWDIQHPPSCSEVKYLYVTEQGAGIGAQFHVYGAALAIAVNLHRQMILSPLVAHWTKGDFCGTDNSWTCFLYPPSGCFPTEEQIKNSQLWNENEKFDASSVVLTVNLYGWNNDIKPIIPKVFLPLLECSPFYKSYYLWWWRAQSVTYLIRPTPKTLTQLEIIKQQEFSNKQILSNSIGMYVRHGDKGGEMKLRDFEEYVSAAEILVSFYPQLNKSVYLGTGDPIVINGSIEINKKGDWKYVWLEEYRTNVGNDILSTNGDKFVLHVLLGLHLQLYADAHIGTFGSNWCRLIMELLSTVGHCAGCPYYEVSQPCSSITECNEKLARLSMEW